MLTLTVYGAAGETLARVNFQRSELADVVEAGRSYLAYLSPSAAADRYEITDSDTGQVIHGRDRWSRAAPAIRTGDRVAYCYDGLDNQVAVEGVVRAIGPAPHNPDGPPCYHVRVDLVLIDGRLAGIAGPFYAYPPASTPPPGAPGAASIARLEPEPARAGQRVPA